MSQFKSNALSPPPDCLSLQVLSQFLYLQLIQSFYSPTTTLLMICPFHLLGQSNPDNDSGLLLHLELQDGGKSKELSKADSWNVELLCCEISVENSKHPELNTMPELISAVYCKPQGTPAGFYLQSRTPGPREGVMPRQFRTLSIRVYSKLPTPDVLQTNVNSTPASGLHVQ